MAIEKLFESLLDKSAAMRALRKSAGKAILLGMIDALQGPNDVVDAQASEIGSEPKVLKDSEQDKPVIPTVALPRPQLIGIAAKTPDDEPDKPGVPPKRVRQKVRGKIGDQPSGENAPTLPPTDGSLTEGAST